MIAVAVAALLTALAPAAAGAPSDAAAAWVGQQAIPSDALAKDAAARAAWHAATPRRYARTPWVYDFHGPSSPTRIMTENGRAFAVGSVCKPHDCGDNILAFVLAPGGAHAAGAILHRDDAGKTAESYFGNPTPLEREWLRAKLREGRN
jgi:hypothetical protein